ncbi:MAG TPA: hypothetical protein VMT88_14395, partial [Actinomycetes bacterium]|nr:hypothetical protein [Actinomycetes bacterium]
HREFQRVANGMNIDRATRILGTNGSLALDPYIIGHRKFTSRWYYKCSGQLPSAQIGYVKRLHRGAPWRVSGKEWNTT